MNEPSAPDLRASDADREAVADRLRDAGEAGRLDVDELEERLTKAYAARTFGELAPLTADLPPAAEAPAGSAPPERALDGPGPSSELDEHRSNWRAKWGSWLGTSILLTGIWAIVSISSGELQFFWPIFPIGFWGLGLVASLFGDGNSRRM